MTIITTFWTCLLGYQNSWSGQVSHFSVFDSKSKWDPTKWQSSSTVSFPRSPIESSFLMVSSCCFSGVTIVGISISWEIRCAIGKLRWKVHDNPMNSQLESEIPRTCLKINNMNNPIPPFRHSAQKFPLFSIKEHGHRYPIGYIGGRIWPARM